jgi:hypothetical protein
MAVVVSGLTYDKRPCKMYINGKLMEALQYQMQRVTKKNWDYVGIIAGYPGTGKSVFSRTIAKFCCPWFDEKYIAFTADEFIEITNKCKPYSAVVLDESFQSLNVRVTMSAAFLKIINHLQIIRQKNLFIILCLPNFFDLSKHVAVWRSEHLFVTYEFDGGKRGRFLAFGKEEKKRLYIAGTKYMNYNAVQCNFVGNYALNDDILSEEAYQVKKRKHLMEQQAQIEDKEEKGKLIGKIVENFNQAGFSVEETAKLTGKSVRTIYLVSKSRGLSWKK